MSMRGCALLLLLMWCVHASIECPYLSCENRCGAQDACTCLENTCNGSLPEITHTKFISRAQCILRDSNPPTECTQGQSEITDRYPYNIISRYVLLPEHTLTVSTLAPLPQYFLTLEIETVNAFGERTLREHKMEILRNQDTTVQLDNYTSMAVQGAFDMQFTITNDFLVYNKNTGEAWSRGVDTVSERNFPEARKVGAIQCGASACSDNPLDPLCDILPDSTFLCKPDPCKVHLDTHLKLPTKLPDVLLYQEGAGAALVARFDPGATSRFFLTYTSTGSLTRAGSSVQPACEIRTQARGCRACEMGWVLEATVWSRTNSGFAYVKALNVDGSFNLGRDVTTRAVQLGVQPQNVTIYGRTDLAENDFKIVIYDPANEHTNFCEMRVNFKADLVDRWFAGNVVWSNGTAIFRTPPPTPAPTALPARPSLLEQPAEFWAELGRVRWILIALIFFFFVVPVLRKANERFAWVSYIRGKIRKWKNDSARMRLCTNKLC